MGESNHLDNPSSSHYLDYEPTLMYGKHTEALGKSAKEALKKIEDEKKMKRNERLRLTPYRPTKFGKLKRLWKHAQLYIKGTVFSEWCFLLFLGIIMALLSFGMDYAIQKIQRARFFLFLQLKHYIVLPYLAWVAYPVFFILFSVYFVNYVSPQAVGSGIPEMKTILRGVVLHEYLTCKVLLSKMVGLTASIGSGLPIGKEGPFVHIASIVATLINKVFAGLSSPYENESRDNDLLAAACAVGVACNFAAPIGGVLFSIEVTATYFAVKNYWRGFFTAVCGAFMFRLLAVWITEEETITALFKTRFRLEFPYDLQELLAFVGIGLLCGILAAAFVFVHRAIVNFNRSQLRWRSFLKKSLLIYPTIVTIIISSLSYPLGAGQYMAGDLTIKQAVSSLFDNHTWTTTNYTNNTDLFNHGWHHPDTSIFFTLSIFILTHFFTTAIAITLAVPSGVFIPVFLIGAAFGRLVGEFMVLLYPDGFHSGGLNYLIVPGGYAVVGAASLSGAVTHTISTAVIVFELTGQISHILPVMLSVLISNAIARMFQPSIYESIIQIKELPYLPDVTVTGKYTKHMNVGRFMMRDVKFVSKTSTYRQLKLLLAQNRFKAFPMVDNSDSRILVGSVQRHDLQELVDDFDNKFINKYSSDTFEELSEPVKEEPSHHETSSTVGRFTRTLSTRSHSVGDNLVDISPAVVNNPTKDFDQVVDFSECCIDEAPFHLVEETSLHKVHTLFSLLRLQRSYVTHIGKLVGVVSLQEIRQAIQQVNKARGRPSNESTPILEVSVHRTGNQVDNLTLNMPPDVDSTDVSDESESESS